MSSPLCLLSSVADPRLEFRVQAENKVAPE